MIQNPNFLPPAPIPAVTPPTFPTALPTIPTIPSTPTVPTVPASLPTPPTISVPSLNVSPPTERKVPQTAGSPAGFPTGPRIPSPILDSPQSSKKPLLPMGPQLPGLPSDGPPKLRPTPIMPSRDPNSTLQVEASTSFSKLRPVSSNFGGSPIPAKKVELHALRPSASVGATPQPGIGLSTSYTNLGTMRARSASTAAPVDKVDNRQEVLTKKENDLLVHKLETRMKELEQLQEHNLRLMKKNPISSPKINFSCQRQKKKKKKKKNGKANDRNPNTPKNRKT
eukprot:TRINITY_DN5405_c0_g1_i3.p2 TRINITY_DN5405_c0_g1~~TRINITY_DN5405_c0_g1_i3.p2  ORF type:complete len:282 (+),score=85.82 TRINITY_DN5405_c0_g1_i3:942-1787(+)